MKKNIGTKDRLIRFTLAIILTVLAFWQESWLLFAFALFTFYEACACWCVVYYFLGKNSCTTK